MSVLGIIILVFVIAFIFIFNSLIMKRNMVDNAFAAIDAQAAPKHAKEV